MYNHKSWCIKLSGWDNHYTGHPCNCGFDAHVEQAYANNTPRTEVARHLMKSGFLKNPMMAFDEADRIIEILTRASVPTH